MSDKKEKCNDRELLEMAAKAAGIELCRGRNITGMHPMMNLLSAPKWNPLTDDGDALRLAVSLSIELYIEGGNEDEAVWADDVMIWIDGDRLSATRRAITRAAAAIGRAM